MNTIVTFGTSFAIVKDYIFRYFPFESVTSYVFVIISALLTYKAVTGFFKLITGGVTG